MPLTLVVDTDQVFIEECKQLAALKLEDGFRFVFASSNEEAVKVLKDEKDLDLAIVAIDKNELHGMDLFRKLSGRKVRVPRIALTHGEDIPIIRQAMNDGAADFLIRPVAPDDLISTVGRVYQDCERRRHAWRTEAQLSAIRREVDIASDIQMRILPTIFPQFDGLDIAAEIRSAKDMSGDFYDVFEVGPNKLGLVVADVAGKGIPAAFFMAVARTLIQATAAHGGDAALCLQQANELLCRHDINHMFVTVFYCTLDLETWTLTYANGGHHPPLVTRGATGKVEALEGGDGIVLGVEKGMDYEKSQITLEPGDSLFLFTDGVTEAFDEDRNQLSEGRLIEFLEKHHGETATELCQGVQSLVKQFAGNADVADDVTTLALKRTF
jgi:sigma-B regulation protein RsbU (phosphoserine phosphatase)